MLDQKHGENITFQGLMLTRLATVSGAKENHGVNNRSNAGQEEDIELEFFDLAMLAKATDDFSPDNKLGEGGFGPVYKVTLHYSAEK